MRKIQLSLLTVALAGLTVACSPDDAGESAPVETSTAVPGMDGDTQPTLGTAATEAPDQ
jgi:hypothetical protein